ncbi:MAG: F0F1 ATP synthase subunit A [Ruminococcaceae bacterium]|nr:F0F1 ATP synthase subunit A [Oscillospiraceae bacterium]
MLMAAEAAAENTFTVNGPLIVASWEMFGMTWNLTESVIVQWIVMLIILAICLILGTGLKVVPTTRRQALAETLVNFVNDMVDGSMGTKYRAYRSYIGILIVYVVLCNLISLVGLRAPTADVSVTGTLAIITFFMTQYNRAKTGGVKGYFKAFLDPLPFMLPSNIIGEISNPVSMALRLFGNMVAGMVIGGLIYFALGNVMPPVFIPAVASLYFDIFSGVIQAYIFTMLTMSYITNAECE